MTSELESIVAAITARQRFVLSSHARPDGDSIGSELALAYALRAVGKEVEVVNRDAVPPSLQSFPGIDDITVTSHVDGSFDAAIILECGSLARTEVSGLDTYYVINIDHHAGNAMYGDLNWFDPAAAACAEMVYEVIAALNIPLTLPIATHLYVAILTDTGAFHHSSISERTFDICRQALAAGVSAPEIAARVYQQGTVGRLRLTGALLDKMDLVGDGQVAVLDVDRQILEYAGCPPDDLEGLVNLPLTARDIRAVAMFKALDDHVRVSLRSKDNIDVRSVASAYGGGGHHNAAGCTIEPGDRAARADVIGRVVEAVSTAVGAPASVLDHRRDA